MARGGHRPGAGRPSGTGRYGEPTVSRRIPLSLVGEVDALLRAAKPQPITQEPLPPEAVRVPESGQVHLMPKCEAASALQALHEADVTARAVVMDPWYRAKSGQGRSAYLAEMVPLLELAARVGQHLFIWGFPEHVSRLVDHWPSRLQMRGWITWWFKNAASRSKGWRPSQQVCLHLSRRGAPIYPEHFYTEHHQEAAKGNRLEYKMTPFSVIEAPLLSGFIDRSQQTGYPAQKPRKVIEPLLRMTCKPGDIVVDPTCGSGTTGEVAAAMGCRAILSDRRGDALRVTRDRLAKSGFLATAPSSFDGA